MADNPHRVVIALAPSNRFSTRSDAHVADIILRRVIEEFGSSDLVKSITIETDKGGT